MGLKSILNKIFRTGPLWSIRSELNLKVDNKFNEFIQPLNSAIHDTQNLLQDTKNLLHDAINLQQNTVNLIHDASNLAIVQHRQVLSNQDTAFYHAWFSLIHPSFAQALAKMAGGDYRDILPGSHLLLMEIARYYLLQKEGLWQLNHEIARFNTTPGPRPPRPASAPRANGRTKLLIVSGMFPSIEHGGGLRLFDIISQLPDDLTIDLFSVYTPAIDEHSYQLLAGRFDQVKLLGEEEFVEPENFLSWLAGLGRQSVYYDIIQCEYPQSTKLLETVRPFGQKIGFTFMECITKSYLIKLRNSIAEKDFASLGRLSESFWEFAVGELKAAQDTDFQIAVTPEDADFVESVSGVRPEIIPTCLSPTQVVDRIEACPDPGPEGDTVVFLGYFGHFPNIDGVKWYMNGVHREVKRQVPGYRFLVVGAGGDEDFKKLLAGDPSVSYTGRVDDIIPHILRGKVCVLPLISGAGIRGKLNQYSLAGRPSVTTTIGNLGLDYTNGESVLVADTQETFAAAIVRLLTDDGFNRNVTARAKAYAREHFTWGRHLGRLVEIYRS